MYGGGLGADPMSLDKRILIVEDSTTQAMRLQHLLKVAGIENKAVLSGQECIDLLAQDNRWDAILSDIDMPEIDGFELCSRLKASDNARHIPFVILVSLKESKDVMRALESGANNMLAKEYDRNYFLPQLQAMLENATQPAQPAAPQRIFFNEQWHEVKASPNHVAAMLVSTFAMAMHEKAARQPVANKA
jgi:PleD family two-component response regulator